MPALLARNVTPRHFNGGQVLEGDARVLRLLRAHHDDHGKDVRHPDGERERLQVEGPEEHGERVSNQNHLEVQ